MDYCRGGGGGAKGMLAPSKIIGGGDWPPPGPRLPTPMVSCFSTICTKHILYRGEEGRRGGDPSH